MLYSSSLVVYLASFGPLAAHTQVLNVPSSPALMILDLSKATASTMPSWPLRVMVHSPVVRSVTVMVPSVLQDTTFGVTSARAFVFSKGEHGAALMRLILDIWNSVGGVLLLGIVFHATL